MLKKRMQGVVVALLVASVATGAVRVQWQSTGALAVGESSVNTEGILEYAYNIGDGTTYTVNGVAFKGTAAGAVADLGGDGNVLWAPTDNGSNAGFSNLAGTFGSLMDSAQWGLGDTETTITLKNLADGTNYLVQVFTSDTRGTRNNTLVMDANTTNAFSSVETGADNAGATVTGTFTADASGEATFTFRYLATSGNANINAIQVRNVDATSSLENLFVHPGIGLTVEGLNTIKANLDVEPWKTGYEDLLSASQSSLDYTPYQDGTLTEVGRLVNNSAWESDMEAIHNMARLWYFTGEEAYAQKGHDILISWANTHTNWLETPNTYLVQGYHAWQVFEGADILRGTWPGWTDADTATCKAYFENVCWKGSMTSVPNPLKSANQGMAQFAPALGIAIFNDDQEKFEQCLQAFRADAAAALGNTLPNGQVGDTGRDAHDQGQLMLMAWAAEAFWNQGVDVYSEFDNRLLAAAEYISRYNLLIDTPFVQAGTVYDVYPSIHSLEGEYANYSIETKMINTLYTAYVTRMGMRAPYLEKYETCTTQNADSFCYLLPADSSTATVAEPITGPAAVASVTSLSQTDLGDCSAGSATYSSGSKIWTITGQGTRLSDSSADVHFAYLPVTGDATILAKITSISGSDDNARAGVLLTETLDENSEMQALVVSNPGGDDEMYSFWRSALASSHNPTGGAGTRTYNSQPDPKVPYWLKIERIGNRINSYSSPDGASWACGESAEYDMGSTVYLGLAVSSDNNSSTATATFSDVRITGGDGGEASDVPAAPQCIMASPGGDQIPLRWLESFEADQYNIWRTTTPGGPYTLIAEVSGTSFIDTNVVFGAYYYYAVSAVNALGESPLSTESTFGYADTDYYEGEDYDAVSGIGTENTRDYFGGLNLSSIGDGEWVRYDDIPIGEGAVFRARCAGYASTNTLQGHIEVRLGSSTGELVATLQPIYTGGTQAWATSETNLSAAAVGTQDICLVFKNATGASGPSINLNWFDIVYPDHTEYDLGRDLTLTYNAATDELVNRGLITAWDSTLSHLKLADGSDLSTLNMAALGVTSWSTLDFNDASKRTIWGGAQLNGITLYADARFGAGDQFTGADFSDVIWGTPLSTADAALFFSGGSGATAATNRTEAICLKGADLSKISGDARTVMINNLGGFDGDTAIGARFDEDFMTRSGWDKSVLIAAGWQFEMSLVAHWTLDEGTGSIAHDATDNGFSGTISNATWVAGASGEALQFDGVAGQVHIPGAAFDSISNQVSVAFWAFGEEGLANNSAFYAANSSNGRILNVHLPWSGTVYWDAGDSGYDRIQKSASAAEYSGSWTHWVFTKNADAGTMQIFRNGVLWHSGTGKTKTMTGIAAGTIGSQVSGAYYTGMLDDVRLYNIALSSDDALSLYQGIADDSTPPAAPAGFSAVAGVGTIRLDWADNSEPDLFSYTLYRSTTHDSGYAPLAENLFVSDYLDGSVANGTSYYYVVTASDFAGNESVYSSEGAATPALEAALSEILVSNEVISAQFVGTLGQDYRVEYTEDLTGTNGWQTVTDIVSLATAPYEVTSPATNHIGFYRIIEVP